MKKIISQISLILLVITIGLISTFIPNAYAESVAGINCPSSVNEGETFNVALILPGNTYAAEANVTVKFSDGTTSSGKIVYVSGMADFPNSLTFTASVAGTTQISATNIIISDSSNNSIEEGGTKTATLTVVAKTVTPETPSTDSSENTNTNTNTNTGTDTGTTNSGTTNTGTTTPNFTEVNETVYTTTRCNLRESYSTSSTKVATVNTGTKLTRKGVGDNGWSKLEYNGKTVYISSQYLTTTAPTTSSDSETTTEETVTFKDTNENLYAKQDCNLRASWSTDSEKVGYLKKGQAVERTGYASNGWSRILYNGKTVYVASRLLSVEKPEEDTNENTVSNTVTNTLTNETVNNEIVNENVTNTQKTEEEILNEIKQEVGVLPEVGINAANIAYVIVTLMAICGLAAGIIYVKNFK